MRNIPRIYFDKALSMQSHISRISIFYLGAIVTILGPILFAAYNLDFKSTLPEFSAITAVAFVAICGSGYLVSFVFLVLKYREYSHNYTLLTTIFFVEEYINQNKKNVDNLNLDDWKKIIVFIHDKTLFQYKFIAEALIGRYLLEDLKSAINSPK